MGHLKHGKILNFSFYILTSIILLSFHNLSYSSQGYEITEISVPGTNYTLPFSINNQGQVVGSAYNGSYYVPFLWENGTFMNLSEQFPDGGNFYDINNSGQIAGTKRVYDGTRYILVPVLFENGITTYLDMLGGTHGNASGINELGQVVGYSHIDSRNQAVLWENGGGALIMPLDDRTNEAQKINDLSQIAIYSGGGLVVSQDNEIIIDLQDGTPEDINNIEQIVGDGIWGEFVSIWDISGNRTDIINPADICWGGGGFSNVRAINDLSQVVGKLECYEPGPSGFDDFPFLWYNDKIYNLNDLILINPGWLISSGTDINNKGEIVGFGNLNDHRSGFLMTPIIQLYHIAGFEPPYDSPDVAITIKKNKCIPLRTELFDKDGFPITDLDVGYPPVLEFESFSGGTEPVVTTEVEGLPPAEAVNGNQFEFIGGRWCYNLKVKDYYTATGTYTFKMVSGNEEEYIIEPTGTIKILVEK